MLLLGIFYLIPFIIIFVVFGNLCDRYQEKRGLPIFIALLLFFGLKFLATFLISYLTMNFSDSFDPREIIIENIFIIHIASFFAGFSSAFIYYRYLKIKFQHTHQFKNSEIENLGEN
ncbi:hypothetical protein [Chryseobacterium caseinilyticum]|uniref:Uncharacterized protein n=1 Tax=Chryseobacterium caseinilyticum TaxID=2771428 RepID=A0ABR8ZCZ3_9FLAO|nr:hypothetical protein [Chryseobacterium caseinilyticum]MBD8082631.1 hypothetical protein [Chryseobacterium caseinilyticum]